MREVQRKLDAFLESPTAELKREKLILNVRQLSKLAAAAETLTWVVSEGEGLDAWAAHVFLYGGTAAVPIPEPSKARKASTTAASARMGGRKKAFGTGEVTNATAQVVAAIDPLASLALRRGEEQRWAMTKVRERLAPHLDRLMALSERTVVTLRLECRAQAVFFLRGVASAGYADEDEPSGPDSFILDLNRCFSSLELIMSRYLTDDVRSYVFDGLSVLMTRTLISQLAGLRRINSHGVQKMSRNVFALQQNLTNMTYAQEPHFDRVRNYYSLTLLNDKQLLAYVHDNPTAFSIDELAAVVKISTPHRRPGSLEAVMVRHRPPLSAVCRDDTLTLPPLKAALQETKMVAERAAAF